MGRTDNETLVERIGMLANTNPNDKDGFQATITLAGLLNDAPEFAEARFIVGASGAYAFAPTIVAQKMLVLARETGDPALALSWLRKAVTVTKGVGGAVKALFGVSCSAPVTLSDDIVLLPFPDVPPSRTRNSVLQEHERANAAGWLRGFELPPQAALYRAGTIEPIFVPAAADLSEAAPQTWFRDLSSAALILALVPKAVPREAAHWVHYDDSDVELLAVLGAGRVFQDVEPILVFEAENVSQEAVVGLLPAYRKLPKGSQDRVRLALERLIRSRSQLHPGNRAIDLAIALEVLFMNDRQGEHRYKIAQRAAKLVRKDRASRMTAFLEIRTVYDMRSDMVHTGTTDNEWTIGSTKRTAHYLIETGDAYCVTAIREILSMGSIPKDWREIEFS